MALITNKPALCHPEKPTHGHGLCQRCYDQQKPKDIEKTKEINARYRERNRDKLNAGQRVKRWVNPEERRRKQREYYYKNREWISKKNKEYRQRNPEVVKNNKLKKTFGITLEEYTKILTEQGGVCAVCKKSPQTKYLAVDHCHKSERIRGLLCAQCNTALGLLQDSLEIIQRLAEYVINNGEQK